MANAGSVDAGREVRTGWVVEEMQGCGKKLHNKHKIKIKNVFCPKHSVTLYWKSGH
jgi:hypothetical protein